MALSEQGSMEPVLSSDAATRVPGAETPCIPLTSQQKALRRKLRRPVKQMYLNLPMEYTPLPWNFTGKQLRDLRRYFLLTQEEAVEKLNALLGSTEDKLKPEIALSTWQNWEEGKTHPHMRTYILLAKLFADENEQIDNYFMEWARALSPSRQSASAWKPINSKKGKIKTPPWYENVKFRHLGTLFMSPFRNR